MISFMSGNMDDFCVEKFHVIFERDLNVVTWRIFTLKFEGMCIEVGSLTMQV
jgi:hypothetical protein